MEQRGHVFFSSNKFNVGYNWFSLTFTTGLSRLREYSEQNNIANINKSVNSLGSSFTGKVISMDGIL
jgi:hypothetical protein